MENLGGFKIEKLGDSNFHVWKQKVELVLAFRELDDVVTDERPPTEVDELAKWKKRDAKAKAVIGLTLSDYHLDHVRGLSTAAEMWKAIINVFQRRTLMNKVKARRDFYSAKMGDDERLLHYINRVRQLAADLKSMEVIVEDEDVAMSILCGLSERFEHLIVAIDTMTGDKALTLEFVKSRLLQEEQRLNDRSVIPDKPDSALISDRRDSRNCSYCKKKGHTEPYCWKKEADEKAKCGSAAGLIGTTDVHDGCSDPGDYVCL